VTPEFSEVLAKQVELIESPDFSLKTAAEDLPFGAPASYWLSVREYDQVGTAAKLDIPLMMVQPEKDSPVTVDGDLTIWKKRLEELARRM
jgi:hypothetical protein